MHWIVRACSCLFSALALAGPAAPAVRAQGIIPPITGPDKVRLGIDGPASPRSGGIYQALAAGYYRKHGLDVSILRPPPEASAAQWLREERLELAILPDIYSLMDSLQAKVPIRAAAAYFQRHPAVLIAHPDAGHDSFEQLRGAPVLLDDRARTTWWPFLRTRFGYADTQLRPYTATPAAFLADRNAITQGDLLADPDRIAAALRAEPVVMQLAETNFKGYAQLLAAGERTIRSRPELMQRFADATAEGWYAYLYGEPAAANTLMRKDNPALSEDALAAQRSAILANGLVDSGDAERLGIGAMTEPRWSGFYASAWQFGQFPRDLDIKSAYTTAFINKRIGIALKRRKQ